MKFRWPFRKKETIDISKLDPPAWLTTTSGVVVTHETALKVTTVLACVRVIAEDIAKYPLNLYKEVTKGKELAIDNPLFNLLKHRPNSWMTSFEWREVMTLHAALTGDGLSLIIHDPRGKVISLRPLMPNWVEIKTDPGGVPIYTVRDKEGREVGTFGPREIFHLRGPCWDTVQGMDAVKLTRTAIGLAIATERYQTKLHERGGRPMGYFTAPGPLGEKTVAELRTMWERDQVGVDNAFKTPIFDMGIEHKAMAQTGVDAQHIQTRAMQIEEICRGFKVFPQMVGHSDKTATYASAEAFFGAHHEHTMLPWIRRWEQVLDRDLLDRAGPLFVRFEINRILMASTKDQAEYFRTMREIGVLSADDILEIIGRNPRADGKGGEYLTPLNMTGNPDDETSE